MRVEEAYMNKIAWHEAHEKAVVQEERVKGDHRVEEAKYGLQSEVDRLTVMVNLYKEKLTRRETENRNLLVEVKR